MILTRAGVGQGPSAAAPPPRRRRSARRHRGAQHEAENVNHFRQRQTRPTLPDLATYIKDVAHWVRRRRYKSNNTEVIPVISTQFQLASLNVDDLGPQSFCQAVQRQAAKRKPDTRQLRDRRSRRKVGAAGEPRHHCPQPSRCGSRQLRARRNRPDEAGLVTEKIGTTCCLPQDKVWVTGGWGALGVIPCWPTPDSSGESGPSALLWHTSDQPSCMSRDSKPRGGANGCCKSLTPLGGGCVVAPRCAGC